MRYQVRLMQPRPVFLLPASSVHTHTPDQSSTILYTHFRVYADEISVQHELVLVHKPQVWCQSIPTGSYELISLSLIHYSISISSCTMYIYTYISRFIYGVLFLYCKVPQKLPQICTVIADIYNRTVA